MADRRDKLNKTLIMIGIVSAVVVIIIAKIFQMKPQSLISVIAVIWAALVVARMFIVNSKNKEYSKMLSYLICKGNRRYERTYFNLHSCICVCFWLPYYEKGGYVSC